MTLGPSDNPFLSIVRPARATASTIKFDIRVVAECLERSLAKGRLIADESLLEAVGWFDPPLLDRAHLAVLQRELDPRSNRAGRPPLHQVSLPDVAKALESEPRLDPFPLYRKRLSERLRSRQRFTGEMLCRPLRRKIRSNDLRTLICGFYRLFSKHFTKGQTSAMIEPYGTLTLPANNRATAYRRMMLVHDILIAGTNHDVPSVPTMFNILSARNSLHSA